MEWRPIDIIMLMLASIVFLAIGVSMGFRLFHPESVTPDQWDALHDNIGEIYVLIGLYMGYQFGKAH